MSDTPQNFQVLENSILFEDEWLLVINKPVGWVVNRSHTYDGLTVQDWMETKVQSPKIKGETDENIGTETAEDETEHPYGTPEEIFANRSGIVHRLDKDTSGVLLLAKDPTTLSHLLSQFQARTIEKTYTALVHGKLTPEKGEIRLPISRGTIDRKKFTVDSRGREATTVFEVTHYYPNRPTGISEKKGHPYQGFSLVQVFPKTGRTHQIRVHMATITHPLVGDPVYCPRKKFRIDQEWCPRIFLHASQISLTHPKTNEIVQFVAPLPEDLQTALQFLSI